MNGHYIKQRRHDITLVEYYVSLSSRSDTYDAAYMRRRKIASVFEASWSKTFHQRNVGSRCKYNSLTN